MKTGKSEAQKEANRRWREKNPDYQRRWKEANRERIRANERARYAADPEPFKANKTRWRKKNPISRRFSKLKCDARARGYAPPACTLAEFKAWFTAHMTGFCECCGEPFQESRHEPHVDHDHVTGALRGLLCLKCNTAEGLGKARLLAVLAYMARLS